MRCRSFVVLFAIETLVAGSVRAENWPCWRGPRGDGSSEEKEVPLRWDGDTGQNIV